MPIDDWWSGAPIGWLRTRLGLIGLTSGDRIEGNKFQVSVRVSLAVGVVLAFSACASRRDPASSSTDDAALGNERVSVSYTNVGDRVKSVRVMVAPDDRGMELEFDTHGGLEHLVNLRHGTRRGPTVSWENEKLVAVGVVGEHGKPNGVFHNFYENGAIMAEQEYVDGVRHGRSREWFQTGQLRVVGSFDRGWPAGEWKEYFDTGGIFQITEYFPRSENLLDQQRPWRRQRRCAVSDDFVNVVVEGNAVANLECSAKRPTPTK